MSDRAADRPGPPIDPALLRRVVAVRYHLAVVTIAGAIQAAGWLAVSFGVGRSVVSVLNGDGVTTTWIVVTAAGLLARAVTTLVTDTVARSLARQAQAQLRSEALAGVFRRSVGPNDDAAAAGSIVELLSGGIVAVEAWFAEYLPAFGEGMIVPPLLLIVAWWLDPLSGFILTITLPLLIVFAILIGWATAARADEQVDATTRLSAHFLDLVKAMGVLRIFGVAHAQISHVRSVASELADRTMTTLRIALMNALAMEFVAMLSVAIVAVTIGIRLAEGHMTLLPGLTVLIIAPEVYLPVRRVGAAFHASASGAAAARRLMELADEPDLRNGVDVPDLRTTPITVTAVTVTRGDRLNLGNVDAIIKPGTLTVITGPSGAGKSTLLGVIGGFVKPTGGDVRIGGVRLRDVSRRGWLAALAWCPQDVTVVGGTIAENVSLGIADATPHDVDAALQKVGLADEISADRHVGTGHPPLSGGEARRVSLARAVLGDPPLWLCDEPTAGLDSVAAERVVDVIADATNNTTRVVATHDERIIGRADHIIELTPVEVNV